MYWDGSAGKADSDSDWDEKTLKLKKHYGNTQVLKVDDADVLLLLLDELGDETRNEINRLSKMGFPLDWAETGPFFYCNRRWIVDAFKKNHLYTIRIKENDAMHKDELCREDPIFMKEHRLWPFGHKHMNCGPDFPLPCFAIVDDSGICDMLWVAQRARGNGLGQKLVEYCLIERARTVITGAVWFWKKCGFKKDQDKFTDYIRKQDDEEIQLEQPEVQTNQPRFAL